MKGKLTRLKKLLSLEGVEGLLAFGLFCLMLASKNPKVSKSRQGRLNNDFNKLTEKSFRPWIYLGSRNFENSYAVYDRHYFNSFSRAMTTLKNFFKCFLV